MDQHNDIPAIEKNDKTHLLWTKYAIEGPRELQSLLENNINEPYKNRYLGGILDEIIKIGTCMMRWLNFEDNLSDKDRSEYPGKHVLLAILDEQALWERKLLEILVDVILFSSTNKEQFFEHYHLLRTYDDTINQSKDFIEFFGAENEANQILIETYKEEIIQHETCYKSDNRKVWFTYCKKHIDVRKPITTSFNRKLKSAVRVSSNFEKVVLGFTYNKYSNASKNVHYTIDHAAVHAQAVNENIMNISFAVMTILVRIQLLLQATPEPINLHIKNALKNDSIFKNHPVGFLFNDNCKIGDYVSTIHGDLGQIVKIHKSDYGYVSYTVRSLNETFPTTDFNTRPGFEFRKLIEAQTLINTVGDSNLLNFDMVNQGVFDSVVLDMWRNGLRDVMSGKLSFQDLIARRGTS